MLKDGDKGAIIQRDRETYAVAPHLPCGLVTPGELRRIADAAERRGAALKVTSEARIAIIGLDEDEVDAVWEELGMDAGSVVGLCIRGVKACPGTTWCKLGKRDSLDMGQRLDARYHGMPMRGKMKMGVSGCIHQCAETCIKDIGLVGTAKGWRLLVGGHGGNRPRLAEEIARDLDEDTVLEAIDRIVEIFKERAKPGRRLDSVIDEMGREAFCEQVLPT